MVQAPVSREKSRRSPWFSSAVLSLLLLTGCNTPSNPGESARLNSRFTEEQPALSGDGRLVAFVTNRNGTAQIAIYDRDRQAFLTLPGLNRDRSMVQNPSLSRTGRYIAYLTHDQGRPEIALYDQAIQRSEIVSHRYRDWIRNPKISPDGRYISFETARRGQWDIEILDRGPNVELDLADGTLIEP